MKVPLFLKQKAPKQSYKCQYALVLCKQRFRAGTELLLFSCDFCSRFVFFFFFWFSFIHYIDYIYIYNTNRLAVKLFPKKTAENWRRNSVPK